MKGISEGKKKKQIFSFAGIYLFIPIILVTLSISVVSCSKSYEFTMGNDFIDSQTRLQVIDTFKVDLKTILLDSLTTSSTKQLLIGDYKDTIFGSVKCESYFDLAYQSFPELDLKAVYDSAAIVMIYSGYSYGDTASLMSVSIHMLNEKIVQYSSGYLYNNTEFDYSPEATGSISFYPSINSIDTSIAIPVNSLGEDLFNRIMEKDESISSSDLFYEYLKGFMVTATSSGNKAVIGFRADQNNLFLRLYYHINSEILEQKSITVTMGPESHQFNNISYDFSDTPLMGIQAGGNEISSLRTGKKAYMQGLTGLLSKIQFPTLQDVLAVRRWKILRADLVITPAKGSYDNFPLPKILHIYDTDKENRVNSVLKDSQGNPLTATFEFDEFYGENTRYTYDITTFINKELSDAYFDYDHGLLIGLEQEKFRSSLDRLLIEGRNPSVKLRLYFLTY